MYKLESFRYSEGGMRDSGNGLQKYYKNHEISCWHWDRGEGGAENNDKNNARLWNKSVGHGTQVYSCYRMETAENIICIAEQNEWPQIRGMFSDVYRNRNPGVLSVFFYFPSSNESQLVSF